MMGLLHSVADDVRFAVRMMRRSPGLTAVAVSTLALGIGVTTAIFSVIYALTLRPLPVSHPEQLVEVDQAELGNLHSYPEWEIFREHQDIFSGVLAYNYFDTHLRVASGKEEQETSALYVSGNYFKTLGISTVIGRALEASDDRPGVPPVCVLGYRLWRQLYGQSRNAVGQPILVDGHEFRIVGVAPQSFFGVVVGDMSEIFMPLEAERMYKDYPLIYERQTPSLDSPATLISFVGRLKPGETVSQANAGLRVLASEVHRALSPESNEVGGREVVRGSLVARPITSDTWLQDMDVVLLLMVMAVVALIIACVNLGNLLLARATKRQGEIATRLALGATRWRLARQLLTESVALSLVGAAAGILIERWATQALLWGLSWPEDQVLLDLSWDTKLVVFAISITLISVLLFGLAPAIRSTRISLYSSLNKGKTSGRRRDRFSNSLLVGLQVGLSMALLISASLLARSLHALLATDLGYDPNGVLVADASWRVASESPQRDAFVGQEMLDRFRSLPGVSSASWSRKFSQMFLPRLTAQGPGGGERKASCYLIFVSSAFFATRRTALLSGRDFNNYDTDASFPTAILSKALARTLFPGMNPTGLRFRESDQRDNGGDYLVEVVGLASDIQYGRPGDLSLPILYRPVPQCGGSCSGLGNYEIRISAHDPDVSKDLKNTAATINPSVALRFSPLSDVLYNSVKRNRAMSWIAMAFSLLVCLIAIIGVYGMTSHATAERTREIGTRMALGAQPGDILRMVLGETMRVVFIGIAFGVGAGFAATRIIRGMLWGVKPTDPLSFGIAVCLMFCVAGIAAFAPARRAMREDPMAALRVE